jgi:hypothetical protein
MGEASKHKFSTVKGSDHGNGYYESSIKLTGLGWHDLKCEFQIDADTVDECGYTLSVGDQSQADAQYAALANAVDHALPNWKAVDEQHDTSKYPTLPRMERRWIFEVGVGPAVELELRKGSTSGREFLVLTFSPP